MPMYLWNSERFADHIDGVSIVLAESVSEARAKAIAKRAEPNKHDHDQDELGRLEADLVVEPTVEDVRFIYGSA